MSERDVKFGAPRDRGRGRGAVSPRLTATTNINLAAEDGRSRATPRSGAIGSLPPFEPSAGAKAQRSPGELGAAPAPGRATPRIARPRPAAGEESAAAESSDNAPAGGGKADATRRESVVALSAARGVGLAGLPGLGVALGELGSPARTDAAVPAPPPRESALGRMLRAVPSLIDVGVSIGGDPARGRAINRLAAPLRALAARRSGRDVANGRIAPPPATSRPTVPAHAARPLPSAAPRALDPDPALDRDVAAQPGRLRRASRYIVNGILDVAIRRFRGAA